jgi:nicotinamidase/pyrazinamidase
MEDNYYEKSMKIDEKAALIIVDMQNDFIPGGSLPVEEGDLIIEELNNIAQKFKKMEDL